MYRACYSLPKESDSPPTKVPWFLVGNSPIVRKTVDVMGRLLELQVYKLQHQDGEGQRIIDITW